MKCGPSRHRVAFENRLVTADGFLFRLPLPSVVVCTSWRDLLKEVIFWSNKKLAFTLLRPSEHCRPEDGRWPHHCIIPLVPTAVASTLIVSTYTISCICLTLLTRSTLDELLVQVLEVDPHKVSAPTFVRIQPKRAAAAVCFSRCLRATHLYK